MTVKDYIKMTSGISEISIKDSNGKYLEINANAVTIMPFVDEEIKDVELYATTKTSTIDNKEQTYCQVKASLILANVTKKEGE